jgi:hypothetical protein
MTLTTTRTNHNTKLYIDGTLHLSIPRNTTITLQSYIDNEKDTPWKYAIELYIPHTQTIKMEYNTEKKWKEILGILDEIL